MLPCVHTVVYSVQVWRESDLQDSLEGKPTETLTDEVPCPVSIWRVDLVLRVESGYSALPGARPLKMPR